MPFDLKKVLDERKGENFTLHSKYINPQLPRVLGQIEFDRFYEKGEGCYLIDDKGDRYLDFLSGFGVFALGPEPPSNRSGVARRPRRRPAQPRADGLLPPLGCPGRGAGGPVAFGDRARVLHQLRAPRRSRAPSSSPGPPRSARASSTATTPFTASPRGRWPSTAGRSSAAVSGRCSRAATSSPSVTPPPWPGSSAAVTWRRSSQSRSRARGSTWRRRSSGRRRSRSAAATRRS